MDRSGKPESHDWNLPERIVERIEGTLREKHLFADDKGFLRTKLNTWEQAVIDIVMQGADFYGWLRNRERAHWALCIPYKFGQKLSGCIATLMFKAFRRGMVKL